MPTKHTSHWLIDAALFTGLIAAFFLDLTGLELHQWIGVGIGVIATYHLLAHWQWVAAVTNRFFGKTSNKSRSYYLINLSILAGFFIITFTGLVISSWLDLTLSNSESWLTIHILASIGTLILVTLKIVLHWRWIAAVTRKVFRPSPAPAANPAPVATCPLSQWAAQPGRVPQGDRLCQRRIPPGAHPGSEQPVSDGSRGSQHRTGKPNRQLVHFERHQPDEQRLCLDLKPVQRQPDLFRAL